MIIPIILFLNLLMALRFVHRVYLFREEYLLSPHTIKTCIFIYLLLLVLCSQTSIFYLLLGIYMPILVFILVEQVIISMVRDKFINQIILLLDSIMSRMKIGNSYRESVQSSLELIKEEKLKKDFKDAWNRVIYYQPFKKCKWDEHHTLYVLLNKALKHSQPLTYLHYIKYSWKMSLSFKKQRRAVLSQIYIQSIVLTFLYIALLIFTVAYYGVGQIKLILLSCLLFLTGTCFIFLKNRKIQWTL